VIVAFRDREFAIAAGLFAGYSRRFDELNPRPQRIDLRQDIDERAAEAFLNFCQMRPYEITADTFADLETLEEDWEVEQLRAVLDEFLRDHARDGLVVQVLGRAIRRGVDTTDLEGLVRRNFDALAHDDRLPGLPIPVLTRVVNYDVDFDDLFGFLTRCLERAGPAASVLFRGVDMGRLTFDQVQHLRRAGAFVWGFTNQSVADVIAGLANEVVRQRLLGDANVAELTQQVQNLNAAAAAAEQAARERVDHLEGQVAELRQQVAAEGERGARLLTEVNGAKSEIELLRSSLILVGSRCLADQDHETAFSRRLLSHAGGCDVKVFRFGGVNGPGGVLEGLRATERPFERRVILSQSSRELMRIVDPAFYEGFNAPGGENWWYEFRLRDAILVNGMRIRSATRQFLASFDICFGADDEVLMAVRNAEWRRAGQEMQFEFREVRTAQLKIRQAGPDGSWFAIKSIEFLSPDTHFGEGIFRTLFNEHRQDIRRFLEVRSRHLSLDELHNQNGPVRLLTYSQPDQWLQIEIVGGKLITNCYRLRRPGGDRLRSWSLLGSNDELRPLDQWTELDRRKENREGEFNELAAFPAVGGPFRYFRVFCTGPTWDDNNQLKLTHFEMYGVLITEPHE
jgi:hypothetical protein